MIKTVVFASNESFSEHPVKYYEVLIKKIIIATEKTDVS